MNKESQTSIIDLKLVWDTMNKVIEGVIPTESDRLILYRFKDKLTDSEKFEFTVNKEFSRIQLKELKDEIEYLIDNRFKVVLKMGFELVPYAEVNWKLMHYGNIYLDNLDTKLARRIAYDINVAIKIKASKTS